MSRRVVVTGMGAITPVGNTVSDFYDSLRVGRNGLGPITRFESEKLACSEAFEVKGFDARKYRTHLLDPFIQYAIAASHEAVDDSGLDLDGIDPFRIGISVSSSKGGMHTLERFKDRFERRPTALLGARIYTSMVPNFAAQWIARRFKVQGPAKCYVAACATGTTALIEGARMVAEGESDYCIAGASDASIVPVMLAGYWKMKALSRSGTMNPFDRNRQGFMVGEGSGILVLETLEGAKARGARIYGEVLGSAYGSDGHDGIHFSHEEGALSRTLSTLLDRSGLLPEDIGYVNLHGTATHSGDLYETSEMKKAFGKKAWEIPMSSTKSITGHMLGASGAVEAIACLLGLQEQFVPPTVGLNNPDPECDLDYVPDGAREKTYRQAISVSMGFGGHVATLALGKVES